VSDRQPVFAGFAVPLTGKVEKVVEDWIVAVVVIAVVAVTLRRTSSEPVERRGRVAT